MSDSATLFLNSKWELREIKAVIERTQGTKVEIKPTLESMPEYFMFNFAGRQMSVWIDMQTPLGTATELSLGANPEAVRILRDIAKVFGGILSESGRSNYEFVRGIMDTEGSALVYHLRYALIQDGINPDDLPALTASMRKWYDTIGKDMKRPTYLNEETK